jgi:hypothetical protein
VSATETVADDRQPTGSDTEPPDAVVEPPVRRGIGRGACVFAGYLLLSLWLWQRLLPHLATRVLGGGQLDPGMFIWWIKWTPYALTHGLDPFRSAYLDAPAGVSAMWNTSVLALGVLFAPVTLAFGPVVSFNLACVLGPPVSAWTAWLWLRRYVNDAPAALGGLVFGFSPFVIVHAGAGHLNLIWLGLLPVIVMLVEDILWRAPQPTWRHGAGLGVAVFAQLLIGSEALLIVTMGCIALAVVVAASNPRSVWPRVRAAFPAAAIAVGVGLVLCAWPLVEQFGGARRIRRPVAPVGSSGGRLAMLVSAPHSLVFHHGYSPAGHLTSVEDGLYVGWPLLVFLVVAVLLIRHRAAFIAAGAAVVAIALQMYGAHWHFAGHSIPAPIAVIKDNIAITRQIQPGRFAIVMWLAIAWLVAAAVHALMTRVPKRWSIAPALVALACLVPLLPRTEAFISRPPRTPALFTSSLRTNIPKGATVMIAPMATVGNSAAEYWQVEADMRFRQVGGYMLHAVPPKFGPSYYPAEKTLNLLFRINPKSSRAYKGPITEPMLANARKELAATAASVFIVSYSRYGEAAQLAIATRLLGRPPDRRFGDASIWYLAAR